MSYINTTAGVIIYVNGVDVTQYLIEGSLSDDSAYTSSIITTKGSITLGGSSAVLDFDKKNYPIGSQVKLFVKLSNGQVSPHPKGVLYVTGSSVNIEDRSLTLDVGCSLAFIADKEDLYETAIANLFTQMLSAESRKIYVIENQDLNTLSSILEVEGSVIYQDQYGNIQKVSAFGEDGLGTKIQPAKFTSFDKYTAVSIESIAETSIENDISSVIIEASVDVPDGMGDDTESEQEPGTRPEPLITSVTTRSVDIPFFYKNESFFGAAYSDRGEGHFGEVSIKLSQDNTSEVVPDCGSPSDAQDTASGNSSGLKAIGSGTVGSKTVTEKVTSGRYVSYSGPGNQVDREETWEYCSGATFASGVFSKYMSDFAATGSQFLSEANGHLSKYNQHLTSRNQAEPGSDKYRYHNCMASTYKRWAEDGARAAGSFIRFGILLNGKMESMFGVSTFTQTINTYGPGGELVKQVTKNYSHEASWDNARIASWSAGWFGSSFSYTNLVNSTPRPDGKIDAPYIYKLKLDGESVKTYKYEILYNTEREVFTSYKDPKSSFVRETYSSSGSNNPNSPDRLIDAKTVNGVQYCSKNSEQKSLEVKLALASGTAPTSSGWFGTGKTYEKKISFPVQFAPVLPIFDSVTTQCISVNTSQEIAKYEAIMKRYASTVAKKISGDNRGFRITEKLRANLFEYYPFYPVQISVESIGKAFTARVASSNWVFDSENVLCSLDCLVSGSIANPVFADPSTKPVYIKAEVTKTVSTALLGLSSSADRIQIGSLPADGDLYLQGVKITIGTIVKKQDIDNGLLVFAPTTTGTADLNVNIAVFDQLNNQIDEKNITETVDISTVISLSTLNPPQTTTTIQIASLPANGTLFLGGNLVTVGQVITITSINSGLLTFKPNQTGTFTVNFEFKTFNSAGQEISSINNVFPPQTVTIVTPDNYFADGGDKDTGDSDGGLDADGGNLDSPVSTGGPAPLEGGDFDSEAAVNLPPPISSSSIPVGNNSVNVESYFGSNVQDLDGSLIGTTTLPTSGGTVEAVFDLVVDFAIRLDVVCKLSFDLITNLGWNYGFFANELGTDIDMGSFIDPNDYDFDYGSFSQPQEPAIESGVV